MTEAVKSGEVFGLRGGILFYGRDGKLYMARYDSASWPGEWEVFEAHIEWWRSADLPESLGGFL